MKQITTIIVAKDSPKYIFESVNSVKKLSEKIVVLDIGLNPDILKKLTDLGVEVIKENSVLYVEEIREKSKNYAKTEYILFLDPDEIIPEKLSDYLIDNYKNYDYFSIPRKNIIFNKWISHARWWPDYQIRLFKKESVIWPNILHAQPDTKGSNFKIPEDEDMAITHHNYESLDEFLIKMIRYAKADAKNRKEYSLGQALTDGKNEFISRYFAFDGYKEGMYGFILSFLQLMYYPLVYFYYWEGGKREGEDNAKIPLKIFKFEKELLIESYFWLGKIKNIPFSKIKYKILKYLIRNES
jgi:(heptosyl)LPS beta-1,4-glucosyltransferase